LAFAAWRAIRVAFGPHGENRGSELAVNVAATIHAGQHWRIAPDAHAAKLRAALAGSGS
jgi:hypothetical protein